MGNTGQEGPRPDTGAQGSGLVSRTCTAAVLERTFGAPMEVLQHLGLPVVLDPGPHLAMRRTG